ncbi:hypothetical protein I302_106230 [Kwoniella bestiolae CBS 10118]|uniref:RNA polymerase II transcription factor n=1 Tax=Kwoniella bestiolae CBS 10118 TaxID=1296100 RepID=A0A1B9G3E1_9TREE|nr:RNA polymerase II transcription factor [Kwoniella bestiolae CBS 10118]OCF25534.1 RNA polymerase II transcription factor [Kwoniella bestiolae CBS 10118]
MAHLRESHAVVVHCDSDYIRAVHGIQELFNRPSVTLRACYAIPHASSSSRTEEPIADVNMDGEAQPTTPAPAPETSSRSGWLVGEELSNAEKEAGFEEKYEIRWPFRSNKSVDDWEGREYVLIHLYTLLGITITANSSPLLLIPSPTPTLPLSTQASYTQIAFETLNTPSFSILPSPLASLYALGATTGIIVHIGATESSIFVITDSIVRWECSTTVQVGELDCRSFLESLLLEDDLLDTELKAAAGKEDLSIEEKRKLVKEVSEVVWNECTGDDVEVPFLKSGNKSVVAGNGTGVVGAEKEDDSFDVAKKLVGDNTPAPATQSHKSKKQQAAAAAAAAKSAQAAADAAAAAAALPQPIDAIVINIPSLPGKEIQLGPVRHRLCEPLLLGKEKGGDTIWEGVGRAIDSASLSLGEKLSLWESVGVVGELARIKSFSPALITYLSPYLLSSADLTSDCQPSKIRLLNIPDYFANFKNSTTELAPFLGGSLVAKVAFLDSQGKHSITKVDYNAKGPAAIYNVSADGQ